LYCLLQLGAAAAGLSDAALLWYLSTGGAEALATLAALGYLALTRASGGPITWQDINDAFQVISTLVGWVPVIGDAVDIVAFGMDTAVNGFSGVDFSLLLVGLVVGSYGALKFADDAVDALRHTPDQRALKDLVDEVTMGGRKPLSSADAETVLDRADEVGYPGVRATAGDVASPSNWTANPVPHIHIPGAGRGGHVPVEPGVQPR
jgi:hypothetical protein